MNQPKFITAICIAFMAFANLAQAQSVCPIGRQATETNAYVVMAPGTTWAHPDNSAYTITFHEPGVFKIDYNGKNKNARRFVDLAGKKSGGRFKGWLHIEVPQFPPITDEYAHVVVHNNGWLAIRMTDIWFSLTNGKCTLNTITHPDFYPPEAGLSKDPEVYNTGFGGVNVLRRYVWVLQD